MFTTIISLSRYLFRYLGRYLSPDIDLPMLLVIYATVSSFLFGSVLLSVFIQFSLLLVNNRFMFHLLHFGKVHSSYMIVSNVSSFMSGGYSQYVGIMLVLLNDYYTLGSRRKGYTLIKVKCSTVTESGINVPFTRIKTNAKLTVKVFLNGPINLVHFFFGQIGPSRLHHSCVICVSSLAFIDGI